MSKSILSLFSGIGGLCHYGIQVAGLERKFKVKQFVENSAYAQQELRRINPLTPIHSDITDYHPGRRNFDIVCLGFPCAGTSGAGDKEGLNDLRSGLWYKALQIIKECRPIFVLIENPEGLCHRGLGAIITQLDEARFVGEWDCISAKMVGLPHKKRNRVFVVAYSDGLQFQKFPTSWEHAIGADLEELRSTWSERSYKPGVVTMAHGVPISIGVPKAIPGNFDARRAYGLSCSPRQSAVAWKRIDYLLSCLK